MMALAAEGATHRHVPADFASKTFDEANTQPASGVFAFQKDESGTWVITGLPDSHNDGAFLSITTSPPPSASTKGHQGPKSMVIYSGRVPAGDSDAAAASAQRIGTVKCHETMSLKSDVILNSHAYEMERKFESATGLCKLEWTSDLPASAEAKQAGDLRSMMCLRQAGTSGSPGPLLCRVLREEPAGLFSPAAGKEDGVDHGVEESAKTVTGQQQAASRHTWRFTKGQIEVYRGTGADLTEGQIQELVSSAVVEIERRARLESNAVGAGSSTAGRLGSALFRSIVG
ncbi:hypothetical protein MN608_08571 [Microdochium nivale]|nr:hypothetical protein MN608_08571 [Microdochium nivale]